MRPALRPAPFPGRGRGASLPSPWSLLRPRSRGRSPRAIVPRPRRIPPILPRDRFNEAELLVDQARWLFECPGPARGERDAHPSFDGIASGRRALAPGKPAAPATVVGPVIPGPDRGADRLADVDVAPTGIRIKVPLERNDPAGAAQ